jgi:hypothetical protein
MTVKDSRNKIEIIKKSVITVLVVLAIFAALLVLIVWGLSGTKTSQAPSSILPQTSTAQASIAPKAVAEVTTVDLTGKWTAQVKETTFTVDIVDSVVTIKMSKDGSSMLYWYGTFPATGSIGENVTSTKLEINKAVLSGADAKTFGVKETSLTFDVSAMGQTKTVEVTHV